MASQFQHRLVGMIVVVAIGVIVLPSILDGEKKYNHDSFAAIPLVPQRETNEQQQRLPPVTAALAEILNTQSAITIEPDHLTGTATTSDAPSQAVASNTAKVNATVTPADIAASQKQATTAVNRVVNSTTKPADKTTDKVASQQTATAKAQTANSSKPSTTAVPTKENKSDISQNKPIQAPTAEAYVIQLAALSNAKAVNELVAKLTLANYRVYTQPRIPVQGKVTRIFIGPEISKSKLDKTLPELKKLTGLTGIIRKYQVIK